MLYRDGPVEFDGATDQVLPASPRGTLVGSFEAFEKAMYDMAAHEQALGIWWRHQKRNWGPLKPCCNRMPNMHASSACARPPVACSEDDSSLPGSWRAHRYWDRLRLWGFWEKFIFLHHPLVCISPGLTSQLAGKTMVSKWWPRLCLQQESLGHVPKLRHPSSGAEWFAREDGGGAEFSIGKLGEKQYMKLLKLWGNSTKKLMVNLVNFCKGKSITWFPDSPLGNFYLWVLLRRWSRRKRGRRCSRCCPSAKRSVQWQRLAEAELRTSAWKYYAKHLEQVGGVHGILSWKWGSPVHPFVKSSKPHFPLGQQNRYVLFWDIPISSNIVGDIPWDLWYPTGFAKRSIPGFQWFYQFFSWSQFWSDLSPSLPGMGWWMVMISAGSTIGNGSQTATTPAGSIGRDLSVLGLPVGDPHVTMGFNIP